MPSAPTSASPSTSNVSPPRAARTARRRDRRVRRTTTSRQPVRTASGAEPFAHRLQQHAVQLAAMDGELRRVEAGVGAAQLAPHHLAEAVGVDQFARADAGAIQRRQQAKRGEFLDRVRQRVDADAEFAQLAHLLEHGAGDAGTRAATAPSPVRRCRRPRSERASRCLPSSPASGPTATRPTLRWPSAAFASAYGPSNR